ncbi:MAG: DNA polymerase III subunit beta [Candidatus Aminicenantes bacterium]|nr:DNA polymerase III subunit beta [Candidatus Aminicenantes bacterium]MDH5744834.1 DNA polymerase III subunit beta [Candidatus Aminicenantes bacterium]
MKFSINKEDILRELQLLQGIVEKRNTMPILANILINATENEIEIIGTDLEVGLKTHFPAKIEETGSITISGKKLFEIVRSLAEEQRVLFNEGKDLIMEILSGESEFKVLCLPKEDYPQVPEPKFEKNIVLPLEKFKDMIDRVYYAITQEQRYYLNGALMLLKDNQMELVSTDGHRLAYTKLAIEGQKAENEIRTIVSKKTLNELRKFEDETIEFDLDENNLFFHIRNRTLISRIIEGKFPNYEAVIPKENPHVLRISREKITNATRRVSLLSTERSRGIKFSIEQNQIKLFSSNPEIGEARDKVDVDYKGEEMEIGFNSQYLLDFLTAVKSENVLFELKDENSAVLLRPEADDEINYLYVLMPMKI